MEQLCYTWTRTGLERVPGVQVRAASEGLRDLGGRRYAALRRFLTYDLPFGGFTLSAATAPVCLQLVDLGDERALLHKVYVGRDPHGRPGAFFIHALVGDRATLALPWALAAWNAPFWKRSEADLVPGDLALPGSSWDELELADPAALPAAEADAERLGYVLAAVLSLGPSRRLVLAATPAAVVGLLGGLCRAVPAAVAARLTFSTYERDGMSDAARIVGTCRPAGERAAAYGAAFDLPAACYRADHALNLASGRRSDLPLAPGAAAYAAFALDGAPSALPSFLAWAEACGVDAAETLLRAFRVANESAATADDLEELIGEPRLLPLALAGREVRGRLLQALSREPGRWQGRIGGALAVVQQQAAGPLAAALGRALEELATEASALAAAHAAAGELAAAVLLHDEVARTAAPASDAARSATLWRQRVRNGQAEASAARRLSALDRWLLALAGRSEPRPPFYEVGPALRTTWEGLAELLAAGLPREWQVAAVQWVIHDAGPGGASRDGAVVVADNESLFVEALGGMGRRAPYRDAVLAFLAALGDGGHPSHLPLVEGLLARGIGEDDAAFFGQLVAFVQHETVALLDFVERNHETLLKRQAIGPGQLTLLHAYLEALTAPWLLEHGQACVALRRLGEEVRPYAHEGVRRRLAAWLAIAEFLRAPAFSGGALYRLARGIENLESLQITIRDTMARSAELDGVVGAVVRSVASCAYEADELRKLLHTRPGSVQNWPCRLLRGLIMEEVRRGVQCRIGQQAINIGVSLTWNRPPCTMDEAVKAAIRGHLDCGVFTAVEKRLRRLLNEDIANQAERARAERTWNGLVEAVQPRKPGLLRGFGRG